MSPERTIILLLILIIISGTVALQIAGEGPKLVCFCFAPSRFGEQHVVLRIGCKRTGETSILRSQGVTHEAFCRVFAVLAVFAGWAPAQVNKSNLTGIVRDATGAA